mgnify:CR=1 FL=1
MVERNRFLAVLTHLVLALGVLVVVAVVVITDGEDTQSVNPVSAVRAADWTDIQLSVVGVDFATFDELRRLLADPDQAPVGGAHGLVDRLLHEPLEALLLRREPLR